MPKDDIYAIGDDMYGLAVVRVARDRLRVVNLDDIYVIEAAGGDTLVYRRGSEVLRDARPLGEVLAAWPEHPFVRVHDGYAVHPIHILELRLRESGRDWELKLEPPLNTVVPISRGYAGDLWEALNMT